MLPTHFYQHLQSFKECVCIKMLIADNILAICRRYVLEKQFISDFQYQQPLFSQDYLRLVLHFVYSWKNLHPEYTDKSAPQINDAVASKLFVSSILYVVNVCSQNASVCPPSSVGCLTNLFCGNYPSPTH